MTLMFAEVCAAHPSTGSGWRNGPWRCEGDKEGDSGLKYLCGGT